MFFQLLFQDNGESSQTNSRENVAAEQTNEEDVKELIIIDPEATVCVTGKSYSRC